MRRGHHQSIAVPFPGRKSAPGVHGVLGRMRATIHPDRLLLLLLIDVAVVSDDLLRGRIDLRPEPKERTRTFQRIVPSVRPAAELSGIKVLRRPTRDSRTIAVRHRNPGDVPNHSASILFAGQCTPRTL